MDYSNEFDILNSLGLLKFESSCYRSLILAMLKAKETTEKYPLLGDANGYESFMFGMLMLDLSVLVYEGLNLLSRKTPIEDILAEAPKNFYDTLKIIRNNHHLYCKYSSYSTKANAVISSRQMEYKTKDNDQFHTMRYDFSLVYQLVPKGKVLLGSDILFDHIYKHEKYLTGVELREYSQYLTSLVTTFSQFEFVNTPEIPQNVVLPLAAQIELFDNKFEDFFNANPLPSPALFRLLIVLSKLSFIDILLDTMINKDELKLAPVWTFFFLRFLSNSYDEVLDSITNLYTHRQSNEEIFESIYSTFTRNPFHDMNYPIAKHLRNMLHYAGNTSRIVFGGETIQINVFKLYSVRSGIKTWDFAYELYSSLRAEIKEWLIALRTTLENNSNLVSS